jgi:hypothetical protein
LTFAACTRDLEECSLHWTDRSAEDIYALCLTSQLNKFPKLLPSGLTGKQRVWDEPVTETEYDLLHKCYSEPNNRTRLLAAAARTVDTAGFTRYTLQLVIYIWRTILSVFSAFNFVAHFAKFTPAGVLFPSIRLVMQA